MFVLIVGYIEPTYIFVLNVQFFLQTLDWHSVESIFFYHDNKQIPNHFIYHRNTHIYLKIIFPHRNQHSLLKCQCLYIPVSYGRCLQCYRKQLLICNITFNLNDGKVLCNFWTFNWYIICTNVNIEVYPIEHKSRK